MGVRDDFYSDELVMDRDDTGSPQTHDRNVTNNYELNLVEDGSTKTACVIRDLQEIQSVLKTKHFNTNLDWNLNIVYYFDISHFRSFKVTVNDRIYIAYMQVLPIFSFLRFLFEEK